MKATARPTLQTLDARAAHDRLPPVVEADERLALAVVVRRPDEQRGRPAGDANLVARSLGGAEPVADERVLVALTSDRRLVGVPGEDARLRRQPADEDVDDRVPDEARVSVAAHGVPEEDVAREDGLA